MWRLPFLCGANRVPNGSKAVKLLLRGRRGQSFLRHVWFPRCRTHIISCNKITRMLHRFSLLPASAHVKCTAQPEMSREPFECILPLCHFPERCASQLPKVLRARKQWHWPHPDQIVSGNLNSTRRPRKKDTQWRLKILLKLPSVQLHIYQ